MVTNCSQVFCWLGVGTQLKSGKVAVKQETALPCASLTERECDLALHARPFTKEKRQMATKTIVKEKKISIDH